jgi:8-oxo-dGTP pyrophosphatase MutT (NUDIX family)
MQSIAKPLSRMIKTFSDFLNEKKKNWSGAGVAIVYDAKILLVHPANGSWVKPVMGIPKGGVEEGEDLLDAALRELREETGIELSPDKLESQVESIDIFNKDGKYQHSLHYFVCRISDLSEIGLDSLAVPKSQLQKEEVDWAGFINIKEAYGKVSRAQLIILDRLS